MQYSDAALRKTIRGGGGHVAPTPSAAGSRGTSSPWVQRLRGNRGCQRCQQGASDRVDKNHHHTGISAKLPGIGREAVIDVNSCDAKKILCVFEEIGNFIGSNSAGFSLGSAL